jgi:DNA (cytosine-5)-methyltransferase 1
MNKIFNILSLFSGGGFLDIGFINCGFQVKEAVEINEYFIQAYNHGMTSYFSKSSNPYIRKGLVSHQDVIAPVDASSTQVQERLKHAHQGITGIVGGPPCQDYSVGGSNGGIEGERGKLIYTYLKIVKDIKPEFLFFENVEGLYKTKRHREAFDAFVTEIADAGYVVWHDLLNVLEYGHPQDRPRIALVAFKTNIVEALVNAGKTLEKDNDKLKRDVKSNFVFKWPTPKYKDPKKFDWPKKSAYGTLVEQDPPTQYKELCAAHAFQGLSNDVPNQNEHFLPRSSRFNEVAEGDTDRKSFKRLHRLRYSPTVAYGNNEVHLHPTESRRLSVREALRLQTVPDEYILPASMPLTPKFKLISNGVPTAMAELIAFEIRETLVNYSKSKQKVAKQEPAHLP